MSKIGRVVGTYRLDDVPEQVIRLPADAEPLTVLALPGGGSVLLAEQPISSAPAVRYNLRRVIADAPHYMNDTSRHLASHVAASGVIAWYIEEQQ